MTNAYQTLFYYRHPEIIYEERVDILDYDPKAFPGYQGTHYYNCDCYDCRDLEHFNRCTDIACDYCNTIRGYNANQLGEHQRYGYGITQRKVTRISGGFIGYLEFMSWPDVYSHQATT